MLGQTYFLFPKTKLAEIQGPLGMCWELARISASLVHRIGRTLSAFCAGFKSWENPANPMFRN